VRHIDRFAERHENEWPIARTRWTKFHLDPAAHALVSESPGSAASVSYDAFGDGVTFISAPLGHETDITGPLAAKLFVSSSTTDADLFLVFRVFSPDMREVVFMARSIPIRRSRKAGCAPRTASSIRNSPPSTGLTIRTTSSRL